jgi:hypothetical protein
MRATTLLRRQLALKRTRVTGFEFTDVGVEIDVAPVTRVPYCSACLRCGRRSAHCVVLCRGCRPSVRCFVCIRSIANAPSDIDRYREMIQAPTRQKTCKTRHLLSAATILGSTICRPKRES